MMLKQPVEGAQWLKCNTQSHMNLSACPARRNRRGIATRCSRADPPWTTPSLQHIPQGVAYECTDRVAPDCTVDE
jgi:hypothetical protein